MNKDKLFIDYPDETEMNRQIKGIIATGIMPKESFYAYLQKMYRQIGFRYIFRDRLEILFVSLLVFGLLAFILLSEQQVRTEEGHIYALLFIVSPLLYATLAILFFVKKQETFDVEMTYKYTVYQLASFRMLLFSVICTIVNGLLITILAFKWEHIQLIQALMISITSLFIFSSLFLYLSIRIKSKMIQLMMMGAWVLTNIWIALYSSEFYHILLGRVPILIYLLVTVACGTLYINNLKQLILFKGIEGVR